MDTSCESPAEEVALLRRCLNDLVSIMALPALWGGGESAQIARTLVDALLGMLRPAFVFVRLNNPGGGPSSTEIVCGPELVDGVTTVEGIGDVLAGRLGEEPSTWLARAQVSIDGAEFFVASARLGIDGEIGIVAVGCQRINFPEQTERLLLDVAQTRRP